MSALERLAAIDARTTAATAAPWKAGDPQPFVPGAQVRLYGPGWSPILIEERSERHVHPTPDATFIVHSRRDVPAMATALRAVLALHQRDERGEGWPAWCKHDAQSWPCATVRIIETELAR